MGREPSGFECLRVIESDLRWLRLWPVISDFDATRSVSPFSPPPHPPCRVPIAGHVGRLSGLKTAAGRRFPPFVLHRLAGPSYLPLVTAAGIMLATVGTIGRAYLLLPLGLLITVGAVIAWVRPDRDLLERMRTSSLPRETGLPILTTGSRSLGWLGLMFLLAVLGWCLSTLIYSYFYLRLYSPQWPQGEISLPPVVLPGVACALLLAGAVAAGWSWHAFRAKRRTPYLIGQGLAAMFATLFLTLHLAELIRLDFTPRTNAYGSIFFMLSWAIDVIVLIGLGIGGIGIASRV